MHDELDHETGLESMTKAELQAEARARGLFAGGLKASLLRRIRDHDRGSQNGQVAEKGAEAAEEEAEPAAAAEEEAEPAEERPAPAEAAEEEGEVAEEPATAPEAAEEEGEPTEEPATAPEAAEEEGEPAEAAEEGEATEVRSEASAVREETLAEGGDEMAATDEGDVARREEAVESRRGDRRDGAGPAIAELLTTARESLGQLTGLPIDSVSGVRPTEGGFRVMVEVVELSRVPSTTDVLASYEVEVDADGNVTGFVRSHRYCRNQTSRE